MAKEEEKEEEVDKGSTLEGSSQFPKSPFVYYGAYHPGQGFMHLQEDPNVDPNRDAAEVSPGLYDTSKTTRKITLDEIELAKRRMYGYGQTSFDPPPPPNPTGKTEWTVPFVGGPLDKTFRTYNSHPPQAVNGHGAVIMYGLTGAEEYTYTRVSATLGFYLHESLSIEQAMGLFIMVYCGVEEEEDENEIDYEAEIDDGEV